MFTLCRTLPKNLHTIPKQTLQATLTTTTTPSTEPLAVLCILDGWGYRETASNNAVVLAKTPHFDTLYGTHSQRGQVGFLDACEAEVGLPKGQIGNSEGKCHIRQ